MLSLAIRRRVLPYNNLLYLIQINYSSKTTDLLIHEQAAIRLVNYLELILELYDGNEELLRRPIGLVDLKTKEERDCLKSGFHQLLPFRDRSGRRVVAIVSTVKISLWLDTITLTVDSR